MAGLTTTHPDADGPDRGVMEKGGTMPHAYTLARRQTVALCEYAV